MLNCKNCGFLISPGKESRREIYTPTDQINFIKRTFFRKDKDYKKYIFCRVCARKIDYKNSNNEFYILIIILIVISLITVFL